MSTAQGDAMRTEPGTGWRVRSILAVALITAAISTSAATAATAAPGAGHQAPLVGMDHPAAIADNYIVVYKDSVQLSSAESAERTVASLGGNIHQTYRHSVRGFAATLSPSAVSQLRADPNVAYIEADTVVSASATQTNPPWGLDRIDQRNRPLSRSYTYNSTGSGVTAYIIDTG